jgi:hypothetical protein
MCNAMSQLTMPVASDLSRRIEESVAIHFTLAILIALNLVALPLDFLAVLYC